MLNCGGHVLWHVVIVKDSGLGGPIFYAPLPIEGGANYRRPISAMKDMLTETVKVETIVVDRSLAQLNAFQDAYPEAGVFFIGFMSTCIAGAVTFQ